MSKRKTGQDGKEYSERVQYMYYLCKQCKISFERCL